jgi:predicted lipoprotein
MTAPTSRRTRPVWKRPKVVGGVLAVVLLAAIAATTTTVSASDPKARAAAEGGSTFDAVEYAQEHYESEVVPNIKDNAVEITELLPQIIDDPEAAGEKYGHRAGVSSPYAYPVSGEGVAGKVDGTLLPLTIDGVPDDVQVMLQIGPAINGTALRDATGLVDFNDFLNQIEYANAATELNNKVKSDVLADFDAKGAEGKTVRFVGAFAYGSNPAVLQITPVELEVTE